MPARSIMIMSLATMNMLTELTSQLLLLFYFFLNWGPRADE